MSASVRLEVASRTDVGRLRPGNEDSFLVDDAAQLVAVADGMGGHQAGEVASATAIDALREGIDRGDTIDDAITSANETVFAMASDDPSLRGMGTTITAGVLDGASLVIGHVGDSRAYLYRDEQLTQLTTDHSVIAELVAAGELTEDEALVDPRRAMITRALGIDAEVTVDVLRVELEPGDRLVLCSDGLTTMIRDDAIAAILAAESARERVADALVDAANAAGGADNITVVVADVVPDTDEVPDTEELPDTEEVPAVDDDPPTSDDPPTNDGPPANEDALEELRAAVVATAPRRRWWQRRRG